MYSAKPAAAILVSMAFLCFPLSAAGKVVILDYHTFLGNGKSNIDYSQDELAEDLDAMSAMGYKFVSLDDAVAGRVEGNANIVITIDDGNHTVYPAFTQVFEPRGIKPYLFIYPAIVLGHVRYALTPEQLRLLAQAGCGIGAHGYHHNPVTDKSWERNPKDFMVEISRPGPALSRIVGAAPTMFGYPFGVYSQRAEEDLAAAGYSWAFAADDKVRQVSFDDPGLDHMAVPRTITYRYQRKALLKILKRLLGYDGPPLVEAPSAPAAIATERFPANVAK
jgi:peptidoglycan/xylan/chitin deacetylase (PgdA/CDA1 family)